MLGMGRLVYFVDFGRHTLLLRFETRYLTFEQAIFIGECTVWLMLADTESETASLANLETYAAVSIPYSPAS